MRNIKHKTSTILQIYIHMKSTWAIPIPCFYLGRSIGRQTPQFIVDRWICNHTDPSEFAQNSQKN